MRKYSVDGCVIDTEGLSDIGTNLLHIWEDIFECNVNNFDVVFFDIGGDSLSAINLSISDIYSIDVGASFIYTYPAISLQAEMLSRQKYNPDIKISVLTKEDSNINLFIIHPTAAGSEIYYKSANHFNGKINLIGVGSYDMNNVDKPITCINELAKIHGGYIIERQFDGVCFLDGWSSGGNFAPAIVNYLASISKEVRHVFLLDSFNFSPPKFSIANESFDVIYDTYN